MSDIAMLVIIVLLLWIAVAITTNNMRVSQKIEYIRQVYADLRRMRMQERRAKRQAAVKQAPAAWVRSVWPDPLPDGDVQAKPYPRFGAVRLEFPGGGW